MTDREKLIQIMENAGSLRQYPGSMASILIENGVTFATDNNAGRKSNADRIRAMSDEELAKLLLDGCRGSKCEDQPQNDFGSVNCFDCRMKWLQQPAEEAE